MTNDHINNFVKLPSRESKIQASEGTIFIATIALKITGANSFLVEKNEIVQEYITKQEFFKRYEE